MYRDSYCQIDLKRIDHNIKEHLKYSIYDKFIAVVKADAYGHGAIEVSRIAIKNNCSLLAVASLDEALELREEFKDIGILVLSETPTRFLNVASKNNISVTIFDKEQLNDINFNLKVHLKVETGMNRLGVKTIEELKELLYICSNNTNIKIEGIYSHLATSDVENDTYFDMQVSRFKEFISSIYIKDIEYIHLSKSATIMHQEQPTFTNCFRLGISMYGLLPNRNYKSDKLKIKQAMSVYSKVIQIQEVNKGEKVGYFNRHEAPEHQYIAVLPIGYADGIIRANAYRDVLINNRKFPIVGRICMDHLFVVVDTNVSIGDKVELIGDTITVDYIADYTNTINYEVTCLLTNKRLQKRYI